MATRTGKKRKIKDLGCKKKIKGAALSQVSAAACLDPGGARVRAAACLDPGGRPRKKT